MPVMWAWLLACTRAPQLDAGQWVLEGDTLRGELVVDDQGCRIGLWGPTLATGGPSLRRCTASVDGDQVWLSFPLQSGAGDATGTGALSADALVLPLGVRPGEFQVTLRRTPGVLADRDQVATDSALALAEQQDAWRKGAFLLHADGGVVGELHVLPGRAVVGLYDPAWMTDGYELVQLRETGPELIVELPVMPSLTGETGLLRVNRLVDQVVAPIGPEPQPEDRRFALVPGEIEPADRDLLVARAQDASLERERTVTTALAQALTALPCEGELSELHALLLAGYRVERSAQGQGCAVRVEPDPIQHGRRLTLQVAADGAVTEQVRPLQVEFSWPE